MLVKASKSPKRIHDQKLGALLILKSITKIHNK